MALVLFILEKLGKDKHVEGVWFPRLDEGSNTSSSTGRIRHKATKHRQTVQIERFERFFVCIWLTEKTGNRQIKSVYISQFVYHNLIGQFGRRIVQHWKFTVLFWLVCI